MNYTFCILSYHGDSPRHSGSLGNPDNPYSHTVLTTNKATAASFEHFSLSIIQYDPTIRRYYVLSYLYHRQTKYKLNI